MENEIKHIICSNIDNWLKTNTKYNNSSLARELGVTDSSVKRWRTEICVPDVALLPRLCEIMNISLSTLFGVVKTSPELSPTEQQLISEYQTNPEFKQFIDRYLSNENYKNVINSIVNISK